MRYSLTDADRTLLALGDEATLVHYRLNALLDRLHEEGQRSESKEGVAARRGVLRNLAVNGPMTVPQIAAIRPVSRQFVQRTVNALEADGLVERRANPGHLRSHLIALTETGAALLDSYVVREAPLLEAAKRAVRSDADVATAVGVLRDVRRHLDNLLATLPTNGVPTDGETNHDPSD